MLTVKDRAKTRKQVLLDSHSLLTMSYAKPSKIPGINHEVGVDVTIVFNDVTQITCSMFRFLGDFRSGGEAALDR